MRPAAEEWRNAFAVCAAAARPRVFDRKTRLGSSDFIGREPVVHQQAHGFGLLLFMGTQCIDGDRDGLNQIRTITIELPFLAAGLWRRIPG